MAFTKTVQDADSYFKHGTLKWNKWDGFEQDQKETALAQAQRELELYTNSTADDPDDDQRYRWDYAIYEYAYHLLVDLPWQKERGKDKTVKPLSKAANKQVDTSAIQPPIIVLSYLGWNRMKLERG